MTTPAPYEDKHIILYALLSCGAFCTSDYSSYGDQVLFIAVLLMERTFYVSGINRQSEGQL